MFVKAVVLCAVALCVVAQEPESPHPAPEPYSFTYESPNEDGSSSARQETGDAEGRITGFYIIKGLDGQDRRVDYIADENGFRAEVSTSELGTTSHEASNALYRSSAPAVDQLIAQWEASGAGGARRKEVSTTTSTLRTSSLTQPRPLSTTSAKVTETVRSEVSGGAQVTPEGYVLVPASAARQAGIQSIGGEISSLSGLNLASRGSASGSASGSQSFRTVTTTSSQTKPLTTTRFVSGVTGGVTGSLFNTRGNQRK